MITVPFAGPVATDLAGGGAVAALRLTDAAKLKDGLAVVGVGGGGGDSGAGREEKLRGDWKEGATDGGAVIIPDTTRQEKRWEGTSTVQKSLSFPGQKESRRLRGTFTFAKDSKFEFSHGAWQFRPS